MARTAHTPIPLPYGPDDGCLYAGVDEAGRGPLAGPVVAAAVVLPAGHTHPLLQDSKRLNAQQREAARTHVMSHALAWAVGMGTVADIDRINILQATYQAMHEAIDGLRLPPQHLLVDGNRFLPHAAYAHTCVVKGDATYACIAAASILAKTIRDDIMRLLHQQYPMYGWNSNQGYPSKAHRAAIRTHGACVWHRRSFKLLPAPELFAQEG